MLAKVLNGAGDVIDEVPVEEASAAGVRDGGQTGASPMQGLFIYVNHIFLVIKNALSFAL